MRLLHSEFHPILGKCHPKNMGGSEIKAYLSYLATTFGVIKRAAGVRRRAAFRESNQDNGGFPVYLFKLFFTVSWLDWPNGHSAKMTQRSHSGFR